MPEAVPPPAESQAPPDQGRSLQITPELIKKIAARVYALMLADIKVERERRRLAPLKPRDSNGGRHAV